MNAKQLVEAGSFDNPADRDQYFKDVINQGERKGQTRGKVVDVPLPSRAKWNAMLAAYAPGCGSPIYVDGLSGMRCGGHLDGVQKFCSHCAPERVVEMLIGERIAGSSSFHQPENFDKVDEGTGWVLYTGGNDWETAPTAMAVIFPANEENKRIWVTIKLPDGLASSDASDVSHDSVEAVELQSHAKKATSTWVKVARRVHGAEDDSGLKPDWKKSFEQALDDPEMKPFVDSKGNDRTKWMAAES